MGNEEAANQIGAHFPEVNDKLINALQLLKFSGNNKLAQASLANKSAEFHNISFSDAIELQDVYKLFKWLLLPVTLFVAFLLIQPEIITSGGERLVQFNKEFERELPFSFVIQNSELQTIKNEDYTLELLTAGNTVPKTVFLVNNGRKIKMASTGAGTFKHTFEKLQKDIQFNFEASGFNSDDFTIKVVERPNLKEFQVVLDYPNYLGKRNERLTNVGNLRVPEGTLVNWQFNTFFTTELAIAFTGADSTYAVEAKNDQLFEFDWQATKSDEYSLLLNNENEIKQQINYSIEVVPDRYPSINLEVFQDTTFYKYIILGGSLSDDYGITKLSLVYRETGNNKEGTWKTERLAIDPSQSTQGYYYQWNLDSLALEKGTEVEYFLKVTDNDGFNGPKSTETSKYVFKRPNKQEIDAEIENSSEATNKSIDKTLNQAKELRERIEELENRLKGNRNLDWQDEKMIEELNKLREELNQQLEELKKQTELNKQLMENFKQPSPEMLEKMDQLQELMENLLDDETKKLYEELQKLLEENKDINQVQDMLQQMQNKEKNLENELERALELFKRMQVEQKMQETIEDLEQLAEEQEELANESENATEEQAEELKSKQEELSQEMENLQEKIEQTQEMNQELENPMPEQNQQSQQQQMESIEQDMNNAEEQLHQQDTKGASESQQKAAQKMRQMQQQMQQSMASMGMQMQQANMDFLRDIVDNLIKLSFNQETLMQNFAAIRQSDPRFVELSQEQLKIKDDAKIVEDSLLALAERVFQIQSFVTRELNSMNSYLDETAVAIKARNKGKAQSQQQFAMTSMNNLALMLDEVLQQMQQQMASSMGQGQKNNKPQNSPSMGDMQQQLNQQIQELQKSGKSGRQLSEELAKMAAEQERIRRALEEMQQKFSPGEGDGKFEGGGEGGEIQKLLQQMEQTEIDLVNKRLTQQTINRQKQIETRLLEVENSMREQEEDNQREANQPKDTETTIPPSFEEYIKLKQKEIELLKTVPLKLNPYYKEEVNEYFKRIDQ